MIINRILLYSITAGTLGVLRRVDAGIPATFVSDGVFMFLSKIPKYLAKITPNFNRFFPRFGQVSVYVFPCLLSPFVIEVKRAIAFENHSCCAWQNSPLSFKKYSINF
jgi:hypothetical protein